MKRTGIFAAILAGFILVSSCNPVRKEQESAGTGKGIPFKGKIELQVDRERSRVDWKGEMLGIYSHFGTVGIESGTVILTDGRITGGEFVVDMRTIKPADDNYSQERPRGNLVAHLESEDFFDVANHPTAVFVITSTTVRTVSGTMTIRGISRPETFRDVTVIMDGDLCRINAKTRVDRKKYGASFDMAVRDMVLGDDIQLNVVLAAEKKAS